MLLTQDETACLVARAQAGDAEAVERLVTHNQRLVRVIAERYAASGAGAGQEVDDLVQWGNIGLLRAIKKFDLGRGLRFSTYAVYWIDSIIRRNASPRAAGLGMTHREGLAVAAIRRARAALLQALGREPAAAEIAEAAGLEPDWVETWLPALDAQASLDQPERAESVDLYELLPAPVEDPGEAAERAATLGEIARCLDQLPERQRVIITRRYLTDLPDSRTAIGRDLGLSSTRVHQIERAAIRRLQFLMGERVEEDGDV